MAPDILTTLRPWLVRTARGMRSVNASMSFEDLCQEGSIAMWKALNAYDPTRGPVDLWLKAKARWSMLNAIARDRAYVTESASDIDDDFECADRSIDMDLAYHEGEIHEAISRLTPKQREYVLRRFWGQQGTRELTSVFGYDPGSLWTSQRNGARKKLRESLAHLSEAR